MKMKFIPEFWNNIEKNAHGANHEMRKLQEAEGQCRGGFYWEEILGGLLFVFYEH